MMAKGLVLRVVTLLSLGYAGTRRAQGQVQAFETEPAAG